MESKNCSTKMLHQAFHTTTNPRGNEGASGSGSGSGMVLPGRTYTKTRRFRRAPPPATTVGVSQVDHATSGLRGEMREGKEGNGGGRMGAGSGSEIAHTIGIGM